jgi:predicted dehydrogenase
VIEARDRAGRVVQVGTMKRFDPSVRLLKELIAGQGERLRYVSVEVNDPDSWPFVAHRDYLAADDVPPELIADAKDKTFEQIAAVLGRDPAPLALKGYAKPYCSSLVHDVNLVHGLLDSMGLRTGEVAGAAFFAKSEGGQAGVRLKPGGALWTMSHVAVPHLADYLERVSLFFDDRIYELEFPSPYLNHQPTTLTEKVSEGHHARTILHRASYQEPFVEELKAWWRAIVESAPVENNLEEARRDIALLAAMGRVAAGNGAG